MAAKTAASLATPEGPKKIKRREIGNGMAERSVDAKAEICLMSGLQGKSFLAGPGSTRRRGKRSFEERGGGSPRLREGLNNPK